jgi:hypothetical protein
MALAIHDANNTAIAVYNSFSPSTGIGRALSATLKLTALSGRAPPTQLQILFWKVSPERSSLQAWCEMKTGNYGLYQQHQYSAIGDRDRNRYVYYTRCRCCTGWYHQEHCNHPRLANGHQPGSGHAGQPGKTIRSYVPGSQEAQHYLPRRPLMVWMVFAGYFRCNKGTYLRERHGHPDSNGLPQHSICAVVEGGDATEIATVLSKKKDQGTFTFGTTAVDITGKYGEPKTIRFSRPTIVNIFVDIELTTYPGYTSQIADQMKVRLQSTSTVWYWRECTHQPDLFTC